ncbi:MAG: sensor histidine kinase [Chloroflexota bacterium]
MSKLEEAKAALEELLENARVGNIIPVRLPGQIEAIHALVEEAEAEHADEIDQLRNVPGGDTGEILLDTAEFFKTAIHDLKNPLASIKGYADLLKNPAMAGELTDMQTQLLEVIRSNSKRMEALLGDVSTMNKIRAGMLPIKAKMDMFKNIAMMIEKGAKPIAQELNRQFEIEVPQGLPLLETDGERLAEAVLKLVENGLRYSPKETGKVTVRAWGDGSNLVITVTDNGVGMTPEELARLGEIFYRADNDVVRAYKGSGLGIPIAYNMVDLLDGTIVVDSTPGEGTTFTLTFKGMT